MIAITLGHEQKYELPYCWNRDMNCRIVGTGPDNPINCRFRDKMEYCMKPRQSRLPGRNSGPQNETCRESVHLPQMCQPAYTNDEQYLVLLKNIRIT